MTSSAVPQTAVKVMVAAYRCGAVELGTWPEPKAPLILAAPRGR
jgi:hypothetical protein